MKINNLGKYSKKVEDTIQVLHRKLVTLDRYLTREESEEAAQAIAELQNILNNIKERQRWIHE